MMDQGEASRSSGHVGQMDRSLQSIAGASIALGEINKLLEKNPELISRPAGDAFRCLFDGVMRELGILDNGAVECPGAGFTMLSNEAGRCVSESLAFVADAAKNNYFLPALGSWVIGTEYGYMRSFEEPQVVSDAVSETEEAVLPAVVEDPALQVAAYVSRSSSGVTSGHSTPLSESAAVVPVASTKKSRLGKDSNSNSGKGSKGRRRRGGRTSRR